MGFVRKTPCAHFFGIAARRIGDLLPQSGEFLYEFRRIWIEAEHIFGHENLPVASSRRANPNGWHANLSRYPVGQRLGYAFQHNRKSASFGQRGRIGFNFRPLRRIAPLCFKAAHHIDILRRQPDMPHYRYAALRQIMHCFSHARAAFQLNRLATGFLQTSQGSTLFLNGSNIGIMGASPAMPLFHNDRIYAATSDEWISISCDAQSCSVDSIEPFHSNGELALRIVDSKVEVWAPSNTPSGGWGVFNETSLIRYETTVFDTYGTAAPGFGSGIIALGNDAGILSVQYQATTESSSEPSDIDAVGLLHYLSILLFFLLTCSSFAIKNWQQFAKTGSAFLLVVAIAVVPELSVKLAEQTASEQSVEWDASWPDEWKGTQVIVFEIDGKEHVIGGLEPQDTVYELTELACELLDITTEIEQQYLGAYLVSFNGSVGDGWEFTIDGNWAPIGMEDAQLNTDSIVEWRPV